MVDRYTKVVLTVIALALIGLLLQRVPSPARADSELCGSSGRPCWVNAFVYTYHPSLPSPVSEPLAVKVVR